MLKPYNKQAIIAVMKNRDELLGAATKKPSIFEFSKWPQWWESGAKELEKTAPGRIVTAPVRLPEAVLTSTTKTVQEVPSIVRSVSNVVPFVALAAGGLGIAYVVYSMKKAGAFKKIIPS
jgi:hypothetical protein